MAGITSEVGIAFGITGTALVASFDRGATGWWGAGLWRRADARRRTDTGGRASIGNWADVKSRGFDVSELIFGRIGGMNCGNGVFDIKIEGDGARFGRLPG